MPVACAAACSSGQQATTGVSEPFQISGAQFIPGPLPGIAPPSLDGGAGAGDGGAPMSVNPTVVGVNYRNNTIISGLGSFGLTGIVSLDAVAVGVRFTDMGTGYWVVPTLGIDDMMSSDRDFSMSATFNPGDSPGYHPMAFVGIDKYGNGGTQFIQPFCMESRVPDNQHACYPMNAVPKAVFSLTWDTGFDVDLHVIAPDGSDLNPKSDLVLGDASALTTTAKVAASNHIDRDSWGNCAPDGWYEEDLIFQTAPPSGPYDIYASPFAACGQSAVRFTLTIREAQSDGNLHVTYTQSGELLANQVTGGLSSGLYITEKVF
jgi:hypothetical protein